MECAEDDDKQGYHRNESSVMLGEWFFKEDEASDEDGSDHARRSEMDLKLIVVKTNSASDGEKVAGNDDDRMSDK